MCESEHSTRTEQHILQLVSDIRSHRDESAALEQLCYCLSSQIGQTLARMGYSMADTEAYTEAVGALHRAAATYDAARETSFHTYASHCIRNALIDLRRGLHRNAFDPLESMAESVASDVDPERELTEREQRERLLAHAAGVLSDFEYRVLVLTLEGLSTADTAAELSVTAKQVDNAKYRIRQNRKLQRFVY